MSCRWCHRGHDGSVSCNAYAAANPPHTLRNWVIGLALLGAFGYWASQPENQSHHDPAPAGSQREFDEAYQEWNDEQDMNSYRGP